MTQTAPERTTNERDLSSSLQDEIRSIHLTSAEKNVMRTRLLEYAQQNSSSAALPKPAPSALHVSLVLVLVAAGLIGGLVILKTDLAKPLTIVFSSLLIPRDTTAVPDQKAQFSSGVTYISNSALALSVSTEKNTYTEGEPIRITVALKNMTGSSVTVPFSSACQAAYRIDGIKLGAEVCAAVLTHITVDAKKTFEWTFTHTTPLPLGRHTIAGEIEGHGISEGSIITMTLPK
jgi:hypothetical protein